MKIIINKIEKLQKPKTKQLSVKVNKNCNNIYSLLLPLLYSLNN